MDLESVKEYLENSGKVDGDGLPLRFFERIIMHGLRVDHIETGRVVCSFKVSPRLLKGSNYLHAGATATLVDLVSSAAVYTVGAPFTGTSEEIEIEARALRVGKAVAVLSVDIRNRNTGKNIAQGRHTKYLHVPSKM